MNDKWLFPSNLDEAKKIQKEMAERVILKDELALPYSLIGGMDVSNTRFDPAKRVYASTVLLDSSLSLVEKTGYSERQDFPYITGFLGFREAPPLVKTFYQLSKQPDVILVDGQGISHPRGLGIASHLGVILDLPTIGVAKSILVGKPEGILEKERGSKVPLIWKDKIIGMVLRTKTNCNPLIISIGHKVSLHTAVEVVLNCTKHYRLPEPIRHAHQAANIFRTQAL